MKSGGRKKEELTKNTKLDFFTRASDIFSDNVKFFLNACEIYKQVLDRNLGEAFCTDVQCKTVYTVEIKHNGSKWGATPKIFCTKEEAKREAEALKVKYPFVSECRVITRRMEES